MTDRPQYDERSILEPTDEEVAAEMASRETPRVHVWVDEVSAMAMALGKDEIPERTYGPGAAYLALYSDEPDEIPPPPPEPHYARKAITWDAARGPVSPPKPVTFRQGAAEMSDGTTAYFDIPQMGHVMAIAFLSLAADVSDFRRAMIELRRAFAPEPRPWKVHQTGRFRQRARR